MVEAAHGAARTKDKYFKNQYHRLAGRRGKKRAIVAVGHSLLVTGYYLITRGRNYEDLGANYFDERNKEMVKRQAVKRLEKLGLSRIETSRRPRTRLTNTIFEGEHVADENRRDWRGQ